MGKLDEIVQLVEQGDVERALALVEQVKQNGSDEERYMLADHLFSWGFLEEAEALVHLLLARYPDERELQLFLAEIYTEMDKEEEALELLIDIEEDDPYYVCACLLMADLYQMQGLDEVSERKLLKAYEKMPDEPLVQFALAELYFTSGQYQKSLPYYEKVMKQVKTMAGTVIAQRMAEAYSLLGEFEQAMFYYEQALNERFDAHTLFQHGFTAYQA
ncbi:MAG: tetratricopeptide repeat protein, partial [Anoxybacillus gonensis]|nr:tetratricopeptide repeat protein [Anoxybacillus gonensis]